MKLFLLISSLLVSLQCGLADNCGSLPPVDNGKFDICADGNSCKQGSVATLTCAKGFRVTGNPKQTCTETKIPLFGGLINKNKPIATWAPVLTPGCVPDATHCAPLGEFQNGVETNCSTTACVQGTSVSFSCNDGFILCGAAGVTCAKVSESESQWSTSQPTCSPQGQSCGFSGTDVWSLFNQLLG